MEQVPKEKQEIVERFTQLIRDYPIVGSVNLESLPAPQLQGMREKLRDKVVLLMGKRRLMKIAIENCKDEKPGVERLIDKLEGMPALLFTSENPFKLAKTIQASKSPAPAKSGQVAPKDIVVPAGPTGFSPGPVIGELGALGIKAGVENGKVAVKQDTTVVKEGEEISPKVAGILQRLNIQPMEIGLDLVAVYEDGEILSRDLLETDEQEIIDKITLAQQYAFNLAMESKFPTKSTTPLLLAKAAEDSFKLGVECKIMNQKTIEPLVAKANTIAVNLKDTLQV